MKKILLLVDLQNCFVNGMGVGNDFYAYIESLLKKFSRKNCKVINLLFDDFYGTTMVGRIRRAIRKVGGVWHISKSDNDGSLQVDGALQLGGFTPKNCRLEICGVYTDQCVRDTAQGLIRLGYRVSVHENGTFGRTGRRHKNGLRILERMGVGIVR